MATDEHRHAHGYGQIGLAGARRTDAKGQFIVEQRLHVSLLRIGARLHPFLAGLDFDRVAHRHFQLIALTHASARAGIAHAQHSVHIRRLNRAPAFQPHIKRVEQAFCFLDGLALTQDLQVIAAPDDLHLERFLDGSQMRVIGAAEVDQKAVIGKLHHPFGRGFRCHQIS